MKSTNQLWAYVLLAVVVASFAWYVTLQFQRTESLGRIEQAIEAKRLTEMGTMTSQWTSGGVQHTYETTQQEGESPDDHATRHAAGLAAMQEQFPPDK